MKYYVKAIYSGWSEVTKENYEAFIENMRNGITTMGSKKKESYINDHVKVVEDGTIENLKATLDVLDSRTKESDKAEKAYEADYMNEEKENAFDKAYEKEYNALMEASELISRITKGKIGLLTAKEMIREKKSEVASIIAKAV